MNEVEVPMATLPRVTLSEVSAEVEAVEDELPAIERKPPISALEPTFRAPPTLAP